MLVLHAGAQQRDSPGARGPVILRCGMAGATSCAPPGARGTGEITVRNGGRNKLRPSRLGKGDGHDGAGGERQLAFAVRAAELARDAKFLAGGVDDTGEAAAVARTPKRSHRRR